MTRVVTSQAELDAALAEQAKGQLDIMIDSPEGVWLALSSGVVGARGKSCVGPVGGSATVRDVRGSATVRGVWGSATVRGVGGSATVSGVWGSATVSGVWGSATVRDVRDSATLHLYDKAAATDVGSYVAVHLHSARAKTDGGVIIDVSSLDLTDPADWCDYHGIKVSKAGVATLYKAVDEAFTTDRSFDYSPGKKPSAPDWRDDHECGGGLHFSPTPSQALAYHDGPRFVEVGVKVADLRPILGGTPKCKAPRVVRACREVDIDRKPVTS